MALNCSVLKVDLIEGLSSIQNVTNKRVTLAILANVLIETSHNALILTGTDLEVGLRIEVPAQIHDKGTLTLPSKKIFEIVRESGSDTISIKETENSWVIISAGHSTYNLAGMPSDEYPEFPEYEEENFVSFDAGVFTDLIDKVIFSVASEEESSYALTNVLFETEKKEEKSYLRMISSDGHRLSIMEKDVIVDIDLLHLEKGRLIPKKGVQELKKFCEIRDNIELSFEEKQLVVRDNHSLMVIRLKNGEFPKYQAIVNAVKLENSIEIERGTFLDSLKRINLFTEDIFHTIQLEIENQQMILTSQNVDLGNAKDIIDVNYGGEPLCIGFNCRYFIDALQVMESNNIEAYINSNASPCLLRSDADEGFIAIIMPMQV